MQNFIDIDDSRVVSLEIYLESISDELRRNEIAGMLEWGMNFLDLMKSNFGTEIPVPEIQVKQTRVVGAEANPFGLIVVTEGMIEHCLNAQWPLAHEVLGQEAPYVLGENLIARLGLAWVLGHEYTHLFNCHHLVEQELGSSLSVQRAFEHDADLCATAGIFRITQRILNQVLYDDAIRRYAAFAIFWIIRSIPETNNGAGVHPSFSERYFQIVLKLITLQENSKEAPDLSVSKPRTRARADRVTGAAMACEAVYQRINGFKEGSYFSEWSEYFSSGGHTRIIRDWIKVSPVVERLVGRRVDMQAEFKALRKAKRSAQKANKVTRKRQRAARRNCR